jgi:cytochrome c
MKFLLALALMAFASQARAQDAARGQLLFLQCRACHSLKAGDANKVGPNLHGFLARAPASAPNFKYSAAFLAAKPAWNDANLDRWLAKPAVLVPGTTMAFAGMTKAPDRAAIIAYLKTATK